MDEPSIGLHQRDNTKLIDTLRHLRELGNTIIVVEHDEETMAAADWIIDIGPGAGEHGGHIVAQGTPDEIMANPDSVTGRYLSAGTKLTSPPSAARPTANLWKSSGRAATTCKMSASKFLSAASSASPASRVRAKAR